MAERLVQDFIAIHGIRALRAKLPNAGVPLWLAERWDLRTIGDRLTVEPPDGSEK